MVKFLINRPVAVFTITLALLVLGLVASGLIPTSLMPDVPIPQITVQISNPNSSARELETNVVRTVRNQLLQVNGLKEITSETRDGFGRIVLRFDYGTDTDLAFIETNEKIDASLNFLPKEIERPRVIKASATDIPVINLTVSLKDNFNPEKFLELSNFTETVLKKRIEQLPDIAVADISGVAKPEIQIIPDRKKLLNLGITAAELANSIKQNNFDYGNILVRDGIYQYNFKFKNPIRSKSEIENIYLNVKGKLVQLKDLARVSLKPGPDRGLVYLNGKRVVVLAIIKQADARVYELNEKLNRLIQTFKKDYPDLEFNSNQDQTRLLKLSINNLKTSLIIGSFLAILIMFFFLKDVKTPLIIAVSIPVSLVLSLLFMYLSGLSVNIISLSGLILGVGMMIDNSIIVIDNITQKIETGKSVSEACIQGTNEMITPLISSVLTTIAVFFPLVFLSGITGALFYDQAVAVSVGLGSSLLVSVILIPVLYKQLKSKELKLEKWFKHDFKTSHIEDYYEKGYTYFTRRKALLFGIAALGVLLFVVLMQVLPYRRLPEIKHNDAVLSIDWNENITVYENQKRLQSVFESLKQVKPVYIQAGAQQFLLQTGPSENLSQATVYFKTPSAGRLNTVVRKLNQTIQQNYPAAHYTFSEPKNVFQYVFGKEKEALTAQVFSQTGLEVPPVEKLDEVYRLIDTAVSSKIALKTTMYIEILFDRMLLYGVSYTDLINELKTAFNFNTIDRLKTAKQFIPIKISYPNTQNNTKLDDLFVKNKNGEAISLRNLVKIYPSEQYKTLFANRLGEYLPFKLNPENPEKQIERIQNRFKTQNRYGVRFEGNFFELKKIRNELIIVVLISVFLLYFIMAAQFESLWLPLIILLEIPIDIGGALLLLSLFGGSLNVMAAIGIIVMSGVVINDSIIKIHTIIMLQRSGLAIDEAIKAGGKLRLKPIIMTSLTTILALLPFLFMNGLGAELQRPLALTVIGGMLLGTFISLYFIPVMYKILGTKNKKRNVQ